jgi:chromosome segregation ATPase
MKTDLFKTNGSSPPKHEQNHSDHLNSPAPEHDETPQTLETFTPNTDAIMRPDSWRRKGGRPPLPTAPKNASDSRTLIAEEVVKTKPSPSRLRYLRALLKSFEHAEAQVRAAEADAIANRLEQEANDLKRTEIEQKRLEYQRRRELGQQRQQSADASEEITALQEENARLRQEKANLNAKVSEQESSMKKLQDESSELQNKFSVVNMDMQNLQRQADELASIKTAVQSELKSVCSAEERMAVLLAELDSLKQQGPYASLERVHGISTELKFLQQMNAKELTHG